MVRAAVTQAVALTLVLANVAFGVVPPPAYLGSWRKDGAGKPMPCDNYTVLRDFQSGWPGKCLSLTQTNMTANETCAQTCLADPECTVWQINDATGCWVGGAGIGKGAVAEKCYGREGDLGFVLKGAQRLQHGQVMVVLDMNATWVDGLYTLGIGDYPNGTEGVARCKAACYSDIHCNFWQFGGTLGCQVETSTYKAANPPVLHNGTAEAKALVAGQIIEHYCESHHPVKKSHLALILGITGGVLALLCLLGILAAVFSKKETKPKRTRAVKLAGPKPAEKKPLMMPPPVMAPQVPVQMVQAVPSYQVVPQAAPLMQTYAAPVQMVASPQVTTVIRR